MVKCWRTIHTNLEPGNCIGDMCAAFVSVGGIKGCAFVVAAHSTALLNIHSIKNMKEVASESKTNS